MMKKFLMIMMVASCFSYSNYLLAETNVSVFSGYRGGGEFEDSITGEKLKFDEGESVGFTIDWAYVENTTIQLFYSHQESKLKSSLNDPAVQFDLDIDYLGIGGSYTWPSNSIEPYLAGTLGITHFRPDVAEYDDASKLHLSLGYGVRIKLSKHFGLKFEARGFGTFLDSDGAIFCGNGGCRILVASSTLFQYELMAGLNFVF